VKTQKVLKILLLVLVSGTLFYWSYQKYFPNAQQPRKTMLALLPQKASIVLFVDVSELRTSAFLGNLYSVMPNPQADPEYAAFIKETGFNYERDLTRVAASFQRKERDYLFFAVAEGKFDTQKLSAYASRNGKREIRNGRELFSFKNAAGTKGISLTFLSKDRIALTSDFAFPIFPDASRTESASSDWSSRFERLAGSSIILISRQDSWLGAALTARAPGGLQSPQLSALLDQLSWVTVGAKPDGDHLRIVLEGECSSDANARQLSDLLNGIVLLAEAGLNDAKTRKQMDPATREVFLDLLKTADISKIDRGDVHAVRLIIELTPKLLNAAPSNQPHAHLPGNYNFSISAGVR
jgi:hypothetical protein